MAVIKEFSKNILTEEMKKDKLIVIDFYAVWCGPCKSFASVFELCAAEMSEYATFGKVNIDDHRDLAIEYKISSIPTLLIIKDGVPVWTQIGSLDLESLKSKIMVFTK